ncbi:Pentatricopeptide repeat-containing protein eli1, chloroplastic [Ancistrocladus abbreviatus]
MSAAPLITTQPPFPSPTNRPSSSTTTSPSTSSRHLHLSHKLASLLDECKSISELHQIHAVILRRGHHDNPILNFKLQKSYSSLGRLDHSTALFNRTSNPNVFFYTAIIHAHAVHSLHQQALRLYVHMLENGIEPNAFTFSSLLKSCSVKDGIVLHSQTIRYGFVDDLYVRTGLLDVYAKGGDVVSSQKLFGKMRARSLVSLTAMLTCYAKHGDLDDARKLFDEMSERDVVCWNVMIDGYTQHGKPDEALGLFSLMLEAKVKPNEVTVLSVLSACAQLSALELGRWLHSYLVNNGIQINVHVGTSLVDMYSKCGSLEDARLVFDSINCKDVVAWNSMIVGYAMHGFSQEALQLFNNMCMEGFRPTDITFIGILNACANAGLVSQGREFFHSMKDAYGIEPKVEHYGCMVNLLGRAGHLQEAYELVKDMKPEPDPILWGTLLGACKLHGSITLGEEIAEFLVSKNFTNSGTHILLSNMYAAVGNWDGAVNARSTMKGIGIQKEPGCSSIEVNNKVHEFLAGDTSHPKSGEIYMMLEQINKRLKVHHGYIPRRDIVLHDIGEREKEQSLEVHSEKLAIAFGLISTQPGSTIKIVKNLRVCLDCHEVTKLISKITGRRIVVRDRNRFHHFENGSCSCADYW